MQGVLTDTGLDDLVGTLVLLQCFGLFVDDPDSAWFSSCPIKKGWYCPSFVDPAVYYYV